MVHVLDSKNHFLFYTDQNRIVIFDINFRGFHFRQIVLHQLFDSLLLFIVLFFLVENLIGQSVFIFANWIYFSKPRIEAFL